MIGQSAMTRTGSGHYVRQALLAAVMVLLLVALLGRIMGYDLRRDEYLKDGGRYRRRRHACFVAEGGALRQVAPRIGLFLLCSAAAAYLAAGQLARADAVLQ